MKITVTVKCNARHEGIELLPDGTYKVAVKAPPQDGKANEAIIKALALHFGVTQNAVKICRGHRSKQKWIEIKN